MTARDDISCPRCGYDLSGARDALHTAPVPDGTCSECGLHFSWTELESGCLNVPRFSYEHGGVFHVGRLIQTLLRCISGYFLWSRLRMSHPIMPARLLLFAAITALVLHVSATGFILAAARFGRIEGWWPQTVYLSYRIPMNSPQPPAVQGLWDYNGSPVFFSDLLPLIAWPYRIAALDLGGGYFLPLRLYPSEAFACWAAQLGTPLAVVLLPQTRRKYRVRKLHILRAICLSVPFAACAYLLLQIPIVTKTLLLPNIYISGQDIMLVVGCGSTFLFGQILWWWCFCRAYLRIPHALGVALVGAILGALVCTLIAIPLNADVLMRLLA